MNTREKFIATAERLADQRGPRGFGLDAVLSEVGVSKTTFYKYFDSKDELSAEVVNQCTEQLINEIREEFAQRFGNEPKACLSNLLPIWLRKIREKHWNGCLFSKYCHAYPDDKEALFAVARAFPRAVRSTIVQLSRDSGAADPERLARQLTIVLQGAATFGFMFKDEEQATCEADAHALMKQLVESAVGGPA